MRPLQQLPGVRREKVGAEEAVHYAGQPPSSRTQDAASPSVQAGPAD